MLFSYPKKPKFRIDSDGYILVYLPGHPRAQNSAGYAGYVLEHLVVATNKLGRNLRETEEVHHLDFNRHHNRWANLLVLEKKQHAKLHLWLERIGYEPTFKTYGYAGSNSKYLNAALAKTHRCGVCSYPISRKQIFCGTDCAGVGSRKVKRPAIKKLIALITKYGYLAVGRMYGVSDNAVRKWVRSAGHNPKVFRRNTGV